jgi:drug/metabolite transporter (DMT)-like permease
MMDLASDANPIGATEVMRLTACLLALALFAWRRGGRRPGAGAAAGSADGRRLSARAITTCIAVMIIGVTDAIAEISFTSAATAGQLSIIGPLSSLYPAVTVLLATALLRERAHPIQALGALCALTGAVLLAV